MAVRTAAPLPLFLVVAVEADLGKAGGQALENVAGAVGGAIVDDHQLPLHVFGQRSGEHQRDAALHHGALVVDRHQDRQLHRVQKSR